MADLGRGDMGHPPQGGPLDLGVTETPPFCPHRSRGPSGGRGTVGVALTSLMRSSHLPTLEVKTPSLG